MAEDNLGRLIDREFRSRAVCSRRPILDTLVDVFGFFDGCDPALALRDSDGQLAGFPLNPQLHADRYQRLRPDRPSESDWEASVRYHLSATPPRGHGREIVALIRGRGQLVLRGIHHPEHA